MTNQTLDFVLAASTTTGFHPGVTFFALWAVIIGAVIGVPIYVIRQRRERRDRR
ncbi:MULTISPECIES: hypothetical protein [Streptacidiphilus]|uniref:LapA family protein n=1 Tax=Streptacidiphilus cavernicola TaxID=3342716 RepID=A0ABV6UQ27_9ACTN|nr:hypothetical protein [Streptacidiphilus jeojiense]